MGSDNRVAINDLTPCTIGHLYSTCRRVQWMVLTAYGRSMIVYKKIHSRETSIVGAARC